MSRVTTVGESAALSRELSDFLIEFSIGLHKNAIYPSGHPLRDSAADLITRRLNALLQERSTLSLGVARHQLIIEGVATEENNPVLRDLALRLHRHHLGAVKFSQGVSAEEVTDVLATVAVEAGRRPRPLGLEDDDVLAQWPHIRLYPLTFEQLQLLEEEEEEAEGKAEMRGSRSRAAQLWIGLARAALASDLDDDTLEQADSADPVVVAKAIDDHKRDAAYDQVVVGYLLQIAEELKSKGGKEAAALQKRISRLVSTLQPDTLHNLMEMGGDVAQRRKFVLDATQGMAVEAVVDLVQAAADSSDQTISHSLVRMLSKLAVHADDGAPLARPAADSALRDQVHRLVSGWNLEDPNPDNYRKALEKMSLEAPAFRGEDSFPAEPERLLAMGFEIEVLGEPVWRSVDQMTARPDLNPLFDLLDAANDGWMKDALWRHVATPERLEEQLAMAPVNMRAVGRMVARMKLAASEPLIAALARSSDTLAGPLLEQLASIGAEVGPLLIARLGTSRWNLVQHLLAAINRMEQWPEGFDAREFARHPDAAVRREAVRLLIKVPQFREQAITTALADPEEKNVRLALGAVMQGCTASQANVLMARANDEALSPDLRALGIRALAGHRSMETLNWLLNRVAGSKMLLFRRSLASKSPEMLAALTGLAAHWSTEPAAKEVLTQASKSSDPEISDAATRRGGAR
ncbi:MAG: hypothetical protein P3B98_00500 [Gemmatimonadota bacterium]|nr:hypothetical protein [Gemmatimonadota bacterium]